MKTTPKIIGISGNARSGKDTLCQIIGDLLRADGFESKRLAFADEVKAELNDLCMNTLGISAFTDDTEQKNIIRPLLVFWGTEFRGAMNQTVWLDKVTEQMTDPEIVYVVSDVRFTYEADALRNMGAHMIHLERLEDGKMIPPANEYERKNNKIISKQCDQTITWETLPTYNEKLNYIENTQYQQIRNYVQTK